MKKMFLYFLVSTSLFLSTMLFSGNTIPRSDQNRNFVAKRFSKNFSIVDLKQLCQDHSEKAQHLYKMALENLEELESIVPQDVAKKIQFYRDLSFFSLNYKNSLTSQCAFKLALRNMNELTNTEKSLIHIFRSIAFHIKVNDCYDAKLAKFLIKIHLDTDYCPTPDQLNRYLCTAAYVGDTTAVKILLSIDADPNFANKDDNDYTPLAYALIQEHGYSKIKHKPFEVKILIRLYELTAEMLIRKGALATHQIWNGVLNNYLNKTYIFMQTNNIAIFRLFENQITNLIEACDDFGHNVVINAFKLGNAKFIKYLYANSLYKNSIRARIANTSSGLPICRSFMSLAKAHYKHYDFKELFEFLIEKNETESSEETNLEALGFTCLWNAIKALDYQCMKSLAQSGIPLRVLYNDGTSVLIRCIQQPRTKSDIKNLIKIIELFGFLGTKYFLHADKSGNNALAYARKEGNTGKSLDNQIIEALIMTPLLYALKTNNPNQEDLVELIGTINNQYGIEIFSYKDSESKTALDYAVDANVDSSIIEALQACCLPNFDH